jgi:protein-disulfide isomerase
VMRNYPLEQHTWAHMAAEAAEAAFEQGKYWEYTDLLFANQKALSAEKIKELASQAGLDRAKFDAALASGKFADAVDRDLTDGTKAGVLGTPAVYVNGRLVVDDSPAGLKAAVEAALKQ